MITEISNPKPTMCWEKDKRRAITPKPFGEAEYIIRADYRSHFEEIRDSSVATGAARRQLDSLLRHPGAESRYRHRDNRAKYFPKRTRMYASPSAHGWISARIGYFLFCKKKVTETGKGRGTPFEVRTA